MGMRTIKDKKGKPLFSYDPTIIKVRKIQDDLYELELLDDKAKRRRT